MSMSSVEIEIDEEMRRSVSAVLQPIGLTEADAVRLLFERIAADQSLPSALKKPNGATRAAMAEADATLASGRLRFHSADELFASLEANCP